MSDEADRRRPRAEALDACVVSERRELAPKADVRYRAFVDPSGGSRDAFTLAIGQRDGERTVIDAVRACPPPFNPSGVVEEAAALLESYGVSRVTGDRYAGEWPLSKRRSAVGCRLARGGGAVCGCLAAADLLVVGLLHTRDALRAFGRGRERGLCDHRCLLLPVAGDLPVRRSVQ